MIVKPGLIKKRARAGIIASMAPAAWYRYGIGITVTGSGVSTWADQSGNGRDLLQGTDAARPALQADNSILFDGTSEFLKASAFTFNQPETIYFLGRQVTWLDNDSIFDGNTTASGRFFQATTTPRVGIEAGTGTAGNSNFALNTYAVASVVFNGASSLVQINNTAPTTGNAGVGNMGGFILGSDGAGAARWSNIQVKEVILFSSAHSSTQRATVASYLARVGGLVF